ncbi:DUF397 domain-containing protein [Actinoalloteichus hymeniacidonis]|uniref:DUF397 family protein n=1 Tax=Actinoalloteichus hymeniacidonis TaxID=340345 RepID=A0AAC9HQB0_9PSEU|nr:DUF397 domain-containing protein [Actinoalloteichus hymeniacidonis]AOS63353.1 putative DUF397 family protein [Actinoalloteichus hymeniacidonis]MBB5908607.1 hypothetical protein [Actinoalloteichus hymeniacidonis]
MAQIEFTRWRKAAASDAAGNNCVEVGLSTRKLVGIRDTKHRAGGTLAVSSEAFGVFVSAIREGRLR